MKSKFLSSSFFRNLLRSIVHLGTGEMAGRLCNIAIVVWLGHRYGVVILGVYALAQSVTQYLQPLIDFGLRHVGARLVAQYPHAAGDIVARVQRRRRWMAAAALPLILIYSLFARLPLGMKIFLFAFSAGGSLYAASLDWAAWGQGRLHLVGLAKSMVPASILAFLLIGRPSSERVLWYAVAGNGFGFLLQGAVFRWWWKKQCSTEQCSKEQPSKEHEKKQRRRQRSLAPEETQHAVYKSLAWQRSSVMGLAWLCYLAFNNIDVLMLGLMSNPEQVGLYGAAYRVLNQALATYYLLTQVLYPQFARHGIEERARMLGGHVLWPLVVSGILIAVCISAARRVVLTVVFGHPFVAAAPLLLLLAWSIPLDFLTSYLSNAFLAWGMEKKVLLCTGTGALINIALNLVFIPRLGARGAAVNTLISYAVLLVALVFTARTAKETCAPTSRAAGHGIAPEFEAVAGPGTETPVGTPTDTAICR
jgi:O-antigen/teichoic acid export membrane protein